MERISQRDDAGDLRICGRPSTHSRTHRLTRQEDLVGRHHFVCEQNRSVEIVFLPGQVPRRQSLRVDIPEVEPKRPDALGCDRLRDPPDERISQVVRSAVRDYEACRWTVGGVDDSAEFCPSRCARKPGFLDLADSVTRQPNTMSPFGYHPG